MQPTLRNVGERGLLALSSPSFVGDIEDTCDPAPSLLLD
jgi:hypothetical protein